ncbi:MAG: hypothetical protein EOR16_16340 [Mesorhizobium sp.]|uniref:hypothetical protein n=1 Tax=Mesorhizobium sp. TaxID=1871066 RepID=UPI000FE91DDB|nr:hypothetical protein [Mesorhizobium sp.]RWI57141.1 MAG: hypothetical protein EOR16_16340 [Mesorhizobium sp.]
MDETVVADIEVDIAEGARRAVQPAGMGLGPVTIPESGAVTAARPPEIMAGIAASRSLTGPSTSRASGASRQWIYR